jgi:MscS family membrane protein
MEILAQVPLLGALDALRDTHPYLRTLATLVVAIAAALVFDMVVIRLARLAVKRTKTNLDDVAIAALHAPILVSLLCGFTWFALEPALELPPLRRSVVGVMGTTVVVLWTAGLNRFGRAALTTLSKRQEEFRLVQPRTLPLFDIGMRMVVFGGGLYFIFVAWGIDVTGWLASAGVVGIAVGFAAQDSLANLFAGLFILADAPYKLGDFLVLPDGTRGRVTEIGLRSTRMITRDDVQVVLPNSTMAAANIVNPSGGANERERVGALVSVSYSADLEHVRTVLKDLARAVPELVLDEPSLAPMVRFRAFGDSGIDVELMGWIHNPELRETAIDKLIVAIHSRFRSEGIEIPYPQREVRMLADAPSDGID